MSCLLAFLPLFGSFLLRAPVNAEEPIYTDCPSNTYYTRGSAFQANLESLLSSLPSAAAASGGFAKNFTGVAPDQAFGLAQCRADVNASDCRSCLEDTVWDMGSKCTAGQKTAMLIYDKCLIRHSNASFFGDADTSVVMYSWNQNNATDPAQFAYILTVLFSNLTKRAAYVSRLKFAAAAVGVTPSVNIYGMAQCTRDLAADDCNRCLVTAVAAIPRCCDGKQGGQVIYRSCSIRFEEYPFYNVQAAEAGMSPEPSPEGGPINSSNHFVPGGTGEDTAGGSGSTRKLRTVLLVTFTVPVGVTLLVLLYFAAYTFQDMKPHENVQVASNRHGNEEMGSLEPLQYALSTLRAATNNFSGKNRLGQGALGPVYKGKLQNGQEIAVKRLSKTSQQGQAQMKNEVALVAKLQHKNLVHLLGYCIEKHERILVYEFLSNKSLDKILYGSTSQLQLSWTQRYKIIYEIGRGLMSLHEDSRYTIIHRDLKPGNILLDADMRPKISDFGLAKLFHIDLSIANTGHVSGTRGYMAPEYLLHGTFSAKSDVFSYGILVLEVITGRRPFENLVKYVWGHWSKGNVPPLLDSCPADDLGHQQMLKCIHIGLLCIQDDPELRPHMASVVLMLNSNFMILAEPTEPVFAVTCERPTREAAPKSSINIASVSDMEPR